MKKKKSSFCMSLLEKSPTLGHMLPNHALSLHQKHANDLIRGFNNTQSSFVHSQLAFFSAPSATL